MTDDDDTANDLPGRTPLRVLFVCSRNKIRSLTAEHLFAKDDRVQVRSAGTSDGARIRVTAGHIGWAELIVVMESRHKTLLRSRFEEELRGKRIACLFIPDEFTYGDPALIALLQDRMAPLLAELD